MLLFQVKLRVMPSCWFALLRCFVRVDGVGLRAVETRLFCNISETFTDPATGVRAFPPPLTP